jgi:hypothetical protein
LLPCVGVQSTSLLDSISDIYCVGTDTGLVAAIALDALPICHFWGHATHMGDAVALLVVNGDSRETVFAYFTALAIVTNSLLLLLVLFLLLVASLGHRQGGLIAFFRDVHSEMHRLHTIGVSLQPLAHVQMWGECLSKLVFWNCQEVQMHFRKFSATN